MLSWAMIRADDVDSKEDTREQLLMFMKKTDLHIERGSTPWIEDNIGIKERSVRGRWPAREIRSRNLDGWRFKGVYRKS